MHRWIVVHLGVVERGLHLDERLTCFLEEGLVSGQRTDDHLVNGIEDLALPVVVVDLHLLMALGVGLKCLCLDGLQVVVTNVLVVLHKGVYFFKAV